MSSVTIYTLQPRFSWVMRDTEGNTGKRAWPYFVGDKQISGLLAQEPFLVNACWNGATAFDAKWFLNSSAAARFIQDSSEEKEEVEDNQANQAELRIHANSSTLGTLLDVNPHIAEPPVTLPLRFRSSPRCFSSECQLTSFDIHRAVAPLRPRIWINPCVKVAYEYRTYFQYVFLQQWWVVAPWRAVWRDRIGMLLRRKYETWPNLCAEWQDGWATANATLAPTSYALAQERSHLG